MKLRESFSASLESVSSFTGRLEQCLSSLSINDRTTIVLAVQELLVNIVRHAYAGREGQIEFELDHMAHEIVIRVRDFADTEFTPTDNLPELDPLSLPESGMGLYIIQQSFDEVRYKHFADGNEWLLRKTLGD